MAKEFNDIWNFPHCLGASDGKHVVLQVPINTGSEFLNYKLTFSIVLLALVDVNYNFMYVNAGGQGQISDGGIFKNCSLYKQLEAHNVDVPQAESLVGRQYPVTYFFLFLGDEAFVLSDKLMKPFSGIHLKHSKQRIFNYRLSSACRVVENVFGIVSAIFRVLRKLVLLDPDMAELIVLTVAYLHNFLRQSSTSCLPIRTFDTEVEGNLIEGAYQNLTKEPMSSLLPLRNIPRKAAMDAKIIRDELAQFFWNEGQIE